ncbi:MAG: hypothetical protein AB7O57_14245 [Hyphomicrobiaceae bacterium]
MLRVKAVAAGVAGLAVLCAGWAMTSAHTTATPDAMLAKDYSAALADADTSWSTLPRNIWLSGLGGGMARQGELVAGDTITINGRDGHPEVIRVTDLELVEGDHIGVPGVRFQLVTGREAGGRMVRFMFAAGAPPHPSMPAPPTGGRAL